MGVFFWGGGVVCEVFFTIYLREHSGVGGGHTCHACHQNEAAGMDGDIMRRPSLTLH